ncbi:iron uptake transporter permease EfeU [Pseudomonas gingeri]|uniref:iron uptake transporter permease EfeU n=1 Tax=Pseudomonas gingeri TaxID=117681 RepID=UPI00159FC24B|nr:iron uptake transporter permease EfeU [Pseudomonas gingeri]NWA01774.1 FTR1 family protein [Pseudomonas gingeri]NWA12873.1 FTR1 family protein [Pseudomonas gingeri]NWA57615.1 FTR1 family protein [Pseudomonas gingeri]NWA93244.1 FTR1 family protein [Pseudomonas gingeri]NWB03396.1 FTR1 family protein [Pseudomonas gingeri]
MLVPFLIMLREGIEAALIVGIIASYLKQTGRGQWMPAVWIGVFLAAALALLVGGGLELMSAEFPQKQQELFEGIVGLIAVGILSSMVFWMRKVARSIKHSLHVSLDHALAGSRHQVWALIAMVFFAVAREGLETVFFLLAVFQQSEGPGAPIGALLGLILAIFVGFAIYTGSMRLNLSLFFRWTGLFILVVAAGILANSVQALHEAGLWNHLQAVVFDISATLPMDGPIGSVLAGMFGYQDAPTVSVVGAYLLYLVIALVMFFIPAAPPAAKQTSSVPNQ